MLSLPGVRIGLAHNQAQVHREFCIDGHSLSAGDADGLSVMMQRAKFRCMATVEDVAALVRDKHPGGLSRLKLLKLLYYAQAWSLVWDGTPLFPDKIEAWDAGPVVRSAWAADRYGASRLGDVGDASRLSPEQRATITEVVRFYGQFDGETLSELTHREAPWREARRGHIGSGPCREPISHESMRRYFSTIPTQGKQLPDAELKPGLEYLVSLPEDQIEALSEDSEEDRSPSARA